MRTLFVVLICLIAWIVLIRPAGSAWRWGLVKWGREKKPGYYDGEAKIYGLLWPISLPIGALMGIVVVAFYSVAVAIDWIDNSAMPFLFKGWDTPSS